jgi:hypothetical protein
MISNLNEMISQRIRDELSERSLKLKPFALKCGIDPSLFRRLLNNKVRWNTSHLEGILNALGISQERLMSKIFQEGSLSEKESMPSLPPPDPKDRWRFEKRVQMARIALKKYPKQFVPIADNFFKILLEGSPKVVHELETGLAFLARSVDESFVERRKDFELRALINRIIEVWNKSDEKGRKALALLVSLISSVPVERLAISDLGHKNGTTGPG